MDEKIPGILWMKKSLVPRHVQIMNESLYIVSVMATACFMIDYYSTLTNLAS